jgi:hypothetical protein
VTTFKPRTAVVTIYTDDYLDRIRHLEQRIEAVEEAIDRARKAEKSSATPRLNHEDSGVGELERQHDQLFDEYEQLVAEAEAEAVQVRLGALPRKTWRSLVTEHPPRQVGADGVTEQQARSDALSGVNDVTFKDALVPMSIVEPAVTEDDLEALSDIDFDRLYLAAFALNRGTVADPKASPVSRLTQTSDETSS